MNDLLGKRVKVYWHFRKKCFSVQYKGKVIAHVDSIYLKNVEFKVSEAGRQRVLREKRKNVHAFVVGEVTERPDMDVYIRVSYNPYQNSTFVYTAMQLPIRSADYASLKEGKIFIGDKYD